MLQDYLKAGYPALCCLTRSPTGQKRFSPVKAGDFSYGIASGVSGTMRTRKSSMKRGTR